MLSSNSSLIYAYRTNLDQSMFGPTAQAAEVLLYPSAEYELDSAVDLSILNEYCLCDLKAQVDGVKCQCRDKILNKSFESLPPRLNRQNIDEEYLENKVQELIDTAVIKINCRLLESYIKKYLNNVAYKYLFHILLRNNMQYFFEFVMCIVTAQNVITKLHILFAIERE